MDEMRVINLARSLEIWVFPRVSTKICARRGIMLGALTSPKLLFSLDKMAPPEVDDVRGLTRRRHFDRVLVRCQDGKKRLCRIRGKIKRRMRMRVGKIVLVSAWGFQSDRQGDIVLRYKRSQAEWVRREPDT